METTTLWEYPSQHYDAVGPDGVRRAMQGDKDYVGATPSWVIWQLLTRYTREKDLVVDPMCGSGTTLDVARDLGRRGLGYDLAPARDDIFRADARRLPLEDSTADFVFVDPPYSTHVQYSNDPACIGQLDAGGDDDGSAYYDAMDGVLDEIHRVLRDRRYMAVFVSDSFRKQRGKPGGRFMPIGFELFERLRRRFKPVDIICVARNNRKLGLSNFRRSAEEGNFFLRGFNYLLIGKKELGRDTAEGASREALRGPLPGESREALRGPPQGESRGSPRAEPRGSSRPHRHS